MPFAFCLLPFALMLALLPGFHFARRPAPAPPSEAEADGLLLRAARDSLDGRDGVVLVMDAQTGRVRALAGGRAAFEEATPPGSAVKPFTMLAALRTGSLSADERLSCRGHYEHEGFKIDCSHPRYRRAFGPAQALANSCNYYFARAARALDAAAYERTLRDFGFGTPTGGGDDGRESPGLLPAEAPGVAEMLGESERIRVSPAQLASAYAALFNGGRLLAPRPARAEGFAPMVRARVEVAPAQRALLLAGMRGAVAYGTASNSGLATLPVYAFGKTGTSTPQDGWRSQGWFVGFAADAKEGEGGASSPGAEPREVPPESVRLLVLVFLKRSRGSDAAKLARPVFEAYARTLGRGPAEEEAGPSESSPVDDARAAGPSSLGGEAAGRALRVRLSREDATASLALEDYVFGVLAAEGSVESEPEALKALAVAARTYAVRNLGRHARDRFDLCDTTHCQRFTPVRDETARPEFYELARRAVRETEGEVLREPSGRVAESYFSAACGGATADLSKLWGAAHAPAHLRGVRDDFCSGAAETWADVIPAEQLTRALRADERSDVGGHVAGVRVVRRDRTGRAELVELEGARRRRLRGWDFKIIVGRTLGWGVLKSSRFEVTRAGSSFVFRGRGFGHGLGLCQAGAHVSAGRGASYRQILAHYFPGAGLGALRDADFGARRGSPGARSDESGAVEGRAVESGVVESRAADDSRRAVEDSGHSLFQTASYLVGEAAPRARPAAAGGVEHYQLRSEHFRLSCPARVARRDAEGLLRSLEAWRADVVRRLERAGVGGGLPDIEVFVHETTGDFVGATGQPAWVAGSTEGRRVDLQPLDVLRRRGVLGTAPRHELIHAALGAAGAGRAPRWLAEGLCAYAAGEGPSLSRRATGERIPADELERRLARPGSAEEMRALYAAAYREVSALIRREGEPAVWRRALR
ncbi:MAG TPA: SpoIID/LytB domain-containing protein [Pyrinomonadaceae bacterium]